MDVPSELPLRRPTLTARAIYPSRGLDQRRSESHNHGIRPQCGSQIWRWVPWFWDLLRRPNLVRSTGSRSNAQIRAGQSMRLQSSKSHQTHHLRTKRRRQRRDPQCLSPPHGMLSLRNPGRCGRRRAAEQALEASVAPKPSQAQARAADQHPEYANCKFAERVEGTQKGGCE